MGFFNFFSDCRVAEPVCQSVLPHTWVTIVIWKLATPECHQYVANQFGVGRSTVGATVIWVCHALQKILLHQVIKLGNAWKIIEVLTTGVPKLY